MKPEELLERLAELEHEQWVAWARAVAGEVAPERRARREPFYGPYAKLSEEAKEQDRVWARRVLEMLREAGIPGAAS
jgi:glutathione S-transferase